MRTSRFAFAALAACSAIFLDACGEKASFSSGVPLPAIKNQGSGDATTDGPKGPALTETYRYQIIVGNGAPVVKQGPVDAVPAVYLNDASAALSGSALSDWSVKIGPSGSVASLSAGKVEKQTLDLSAASGLTRIDALFNQGSGKRNGRASQSIFVDGEPPLATIVDLGMSGAQRQIFWTATDNYAVDPTKSALVACTKATPDFTPKARADLANLPSSCTILYQGADLQKQGDHILIGATQLGGQAVSPDQMRFLLYVEDLVGFPASAWMVDAAQSQSQLVLSSPVSQIIYTNQTSVTASLALQKVGGGAAAVDISAQANASTWSNYETLLSTGSSSSQQDFQPQLSLSLPAQEGLVQAVLQVREKASGAVSNKLNINVVVDKTAPAVGAVAINLPSAVLDSSTMVTVTWDAQDANGIASQYLEIEPTNANVWTKLNLAVNGADRSATFKWSDTGLAPHGFSVRVHAIDAAGNEGVGTSQPWIPQIFNAALLTSNVQCFFCHMRIEGDAGGMNLPATIDRTDTGENFSITGAFYATNAIPSLLSNKAAGGDFPNYNNNGLKIFPKILSTSGTPQFPMLSASLLSPRMNGTIRQGTNFYQRVVSGNLILIGTDTAPIQINGEVFVTGDLVIKGKYTGVGTIYANNIFIVDDLLAVNPPAPYPTDPTKALPQAISDIKAQKDGLYLGAINDLLVGDPDFTLAQAALPDNQHPYAFLFSWLPKTQYQALGEQAITVAGFNIDGDQGNSALIPAPSDARVNCEVNRVDAYLYAGTQVMWRSYGNLLLNGGVMTPTMTLLSSYPYRLYHFYNYGSYPATQGPINPRNGVTTSINLVRYDYRLRAGGPGFETIKSFFDQQD